jgi:hypothetical protein
MQLTRQDVADIARGAAFLGSGGGGDPYYGRLMVDRAMADGCPITLIDPDDLPDEALIIPTAMMGAPTILTEKLPRGDELLLSLLRLEKHLGQPVFGTMPIEIGGVNSMFPLLVGARLGLPIVDADGMGRAFPELQMETFHIYGISGTPMVITNEYGDSALLTTHDNGMMEWLARSTTIRMGGATYIAEYPMDGQTVRRSAVPRTISLALAIGRCIREAGQSQRNPFLALIALFETTAYKVGVIIFEGKVIDVLRQTTESFAKGTAVIESTYDNYQLMEIVFQNEFLMARQEGRLRAIVPDLICILDSRTANPIATEHIRYGQQVKVMAVSAPDMLRTPEALAVFGPPAFGFQEAFRPLETLLEEEHRWLTV